MAKRGRPKKLDKAKNRVHSVYLDPVAEKIYREVSKKRERTNWLSEYTSEHIKRDFYNGSRALVLEDMRLLKRKQEKIKEQIAEKARELDKFNDLAIQKEIKAEKKLIGVRP